MLTVAIGDMMTAYTDAANRLNPDFVNLNGGVLNGQILTPGLYKWISTVTVTNMITFDGGPDDIWILQ
eukprot:scaffold12356_cov1344-Chaetoceros_neogracile.AAC.1